MIKNIPYSLFAVLLLVCAGNTTVIYTDVSADSLYIGDRIELTVSILVPKGAKIAPPETDAGFGNIIVKNWDIDKTERKVSDSLAFKYLLTTYTVESCTIPALAYVHIKESGQDTLRSRAIPLRVVSAIQANQGDTIRLKDIKPQLSAGSPSLLWLWILLGAALSGALIYAGSRLWKKHKKGPPPLPPKPPYEEAIEALARLQGKDLLTRGLFREYVFELSEILKRYMGRRFESNAAEYTTEEILSWIGTAPFDAELTKSMERFFNETHPIKFAKMIPDAAMVKRLYEETRLFIEKTKPAPQAVQTQPAEHGDKA